MLDMMLLASTIPAAFLSGTGVAVEMLITAVLVMVVFAAAADSNNAPNVKGSAPLAIGTSIFACLSNFTVQYYDAKVQKVNLKSAKRCDMIKGSKR